MQKPILYYQFDEDEFRVYHYSKGYFDYRRDGFGEVVTQREELHNLIEQYLANGCALKDEYRKRIMRFFPLHDDKNCRRVYDAIISLS